MAVYGYPRASTKKQVDSPETQMENIRKYADLHGLGEVTFFVDAAKTARSRGRSGCWAGTVCSGSSRATT